MKRETGVRIAIVSLSETRCVNSQCKTADDKTKKRQEMNRNDPCKAGLGPRLLLRQVIESAVTVETSVSSAHTCAACGAKKP